MESSNTKYVAVFASFIHANVPKKGVRSVSCTTSLFLFLALLGFSPMLEGDFDMTSQSHMNLLEHILGVFNRTLENVLCLVGDNCAVNTHLADLCGLPLVGCASHRFNLEVISILDTQYEPLLEKVIYD
jgi:ABC-type antimicrobial peptide transport system permease subunit